MLFLIGMPLAGKSYWARELARHYQLSFTDLDTEIERRVGMPIHDIFKQQGEDGFRKHEQSVLKNLIMKKEADIIACGGGTPAFYDNMERMKQHGCVVYLEADTTTLIERFAAATTERPLLKQADNRKEALDELLAQRKNIYEQAHYTLDTNRLSVSNFEQIIALCTNRQ
ncbi:MAG TPA: shikimate kinase [Flavipsychrobacter sp.]